MAELTAILAQINPVVGDIEGNTEQVLAQARAASQQGAQVIVFPELVLTGYPPEDLLLRPSLMPRIQQSLDQLLAELPGALYCIIGYPRRTDAGLFNMAGVLHQGELIAEYAKQELPNYQVFDEKRYFQPGNQPCVFSLAGISTALTVCEDIWQSGPALQAKAAGAQLLINLNASPYHLNKQLERQQLLVERTAQAGCPILYVNNVGGQDELVFDGGSMAVNADGSLAVLAPNYVECLQPVRLRHEDSGVLLLAGDCAPALSFHASVYQALVLGVRDYVNKNGFKGVVLGLSGGIDSALTLAIAHDALGADRVEAVMMPFRYTSQMSLEDAAEEARLLQVGYQILPIEPMFEAFMGTLADAFAGTQRDTTEENLQARIRGVLLMALSNKKGYLVLTTGNKSEMAVGYSTLYGDMAGGFDVLKDVPKTLVFELSRYRNTMSPVIPQRVIDRPPSAELAPDQKDQDSLPPYEVLDQILEYYVERDYSLNAIIAEGFAEADVKRVVRLVDLNEYKRRQAPVGPRMTQRGFGRDRRYPITNRWKPGI